MIRKIVYMVFALALFSIPVMAQINVGEMAPNFTLNTIDGEEFTLSDYEGSIVLLYFMGYN